MRTISRATGRGALAARFGIGFAADCDAFLAAVFGAFLAAFSGAFRAAVFGAFLAAVFGAGRAAFLTAGFAGRTAMGFCPGRARPPSFPLPAFFLTPPIRAPKLKSGVTIVAFIREIFGTSTYWLV